jgi:O-antigen/teichoic acid export membrane protein
VLIIASILAIPRAFQDIPDTLLRSFDRQNLLLKWMIVTGVVNLALDVALIPHYGAVGAAWSNGIAQTFGIVVLWIQARRICVFGWPTKAMTRLLAAAILMASVAYAISKSSPGVGGMVVALAVATPMYVLLLRLFRGLAGADLPRLSLVANGLPPGVRRPYLATLGFIIPE